MQKPDVAGAGILLTFAIPTYNRRECLELLVESVLGQIAAVNAPEFRVELLICNNASTDGTTDYLDAMARQGAARVIHHALNLGADRNLASCVDAARGRYVWIFGDDDLPFEGVLEAVVKCLEKEGPDLLYLPAQWQAGDLRSVRNKRPASNTVFVTDAMTLAMKANTYITFISSWVVHRQAYIALATPPDPARFVGTSLVQLEWHLTLLARGKKFMAADSDWLVARSGNSGGYSVFDVFTRHYTGILDAKLGDQPRLRRFFRNHLLRSYLPGLVWSMHKGAIGRFEECDSDRLQALVRSTWPEPSLFVTLLLPIIRWPRPFAGLAFGVSWICCKIWLSSLARRRAIG